MQFSDICLITKNVLALTAFYATIFKAQADGDNIHTTLTAAGLSIAIYDQTAAKEDMGFDFSDSGTGCITIGFQVDDIDSEYDRIRKLNVPHLTNPVTWPWGARSFRFQDLDGNILVFKKLL